MQGKDVIARAIKLQGRRYTFGAYAPKNNANYTGDFDCAEFISYNVYQEYGILYGTEGNSLKKDDAYTGYLDRDAKKLGIIITVEQAARTAGAILLRVPSGSAIGHSAFSQGNGKTIEAHSTKMGVIESVVDGRRWSYGILLPGVAYQEEVLVITKVPIIVYRLKSPYMRDAYIGKIQKALGLTEDNIYGPNTQAAVVAYQKKKGLITDGEVMPGGQTTKSLGL